jgi:acyl-CoA reductase-like NAD-dependent aldehyde dehydrogenase
MSVNCVIPALTAVNTVLLKPSPPTPLTAERFREALVAAGVPENVIRVRSTFHENNTTECQQLWEQLSPRMRCNIRWWILSALLVA